MADTLELQEALMMIGHYPGTRDGLMGPNTKRAIREFQEENDLDADGIAGPNTNARLVERLGEASARAIELTTRFG